MPVRDLTVTGIEQAACMDLTHAATSSGSRIRQAPKVPFCTRSDGHPTLIFDLVVAELLRHRGALRHRDRVIAAKL